MDRMRLMRLGARGRCAVGVVAAALMGVAGCDAGGGPGGAATSGTGVEFGSGVVHIESGTDTLTLEADVAELPEQRSQGLMERLHMPEDAGMIFLFDREQGEGAGFYMFRTRIPLDIAFVDGSGRIVSILEMEPCASPNPATCPRYTPGTPYMAALEVNKGYFARHGIEAGDRVVLLRGDGGTWPPGEELGATLVPGAEVTADGES